MDIFHGSANKWDVKVSTVHIYQIITSGSDYQTVRTGCKCVIDAHIAQCLLGRPTFAHYAEK